MWSQDFKELLNQHEVEYLIVGGYALGIYGYPRYTGDFDVQINPIPDNAHKVAGNKIGILKAIRIQGDWNLTQLQAREKLMEAFASKTFTTILAKHGIDRP